MPRISNRQLIAGGSVLCAALAASAAVALVPSGSSASGHQVATADFALVTQSKSGAFGSAASAASSAASDASVVQQAKSAAAQRAHAIQLTQISAAAHKAHLALLAKRAAEARAAAAEAARAAAARQAAAQSAQSSSTSTGSGSAGSGSGSSSSGTVSTPSGSPQEIAQQMLDAAGQGGQFSCLDSLWSRESGWNVYASNPSSGAYGIPQALPGSKMASAGPDWQSNAATQIKWGLSYIDSTYGSPCSAWSHEEATGWY